MSILESLLAATERQADALERIAAAMEAYAGAETTEPAEAEEPTPPPAPAPKTAGKGGGKKAPAVTLDEVKAKLRTVVADLGQPKVVEIIKAHGASNVKDLDASVYAAVIAAADEALAGGAEDPLA
jgi:3-oxoacyl-(acyl-carrier-protein) synthase